MCGRYTLTVTDVADHFKAEQRTFDFAPSYNIAPTQRVPVVLERDGERVLTPAKWGLLPGWVRDPKTFKVNLFNARSESAAEKASFKGPLRHKRAIIPASGFYEWLRSEVKVKTPYYIRLAGNKPIGFAGLYDLWNDDILSCTILTTTPNELMATLHDRMPVILSPNDYSQWLNPGTTDPDDVLSLLRPYSGELRAYPVSSAVNSPRNNGPELLTPA